jgi:ankyrin repeat protein
LATLGLGESSGLPALWDALAKARGRVSGGTSLAAMAWGGAVDRARALLRDHGADVRATHDLALRAAAENRQVAALRLLVAHGANVHSHADIALRDAAARGSYAVVEALVALGANVRALDDSALRAAARNGHARVVAFLLASGADADANSQEPLRLAAAFGHLPVVEALVAGGASLHCGLRCAVEQKQWPVVLLLARSGADVRIDGDYALRAAAAFGELGVVEGLVARGARSYDALECAFRSGHARVVEVLAGC